jgi:hypothetical protein
LPWRGIPQAVHHPARAGSALTPKEKIMAVDEEKQAAMKKAIKVSNKIAVLQLNVDKSVEKFRERRQSLCDKKIKALIAELTPLEGDYLADLQAKMEVPDNFKGK